jgi:hypothetical protein
MHVSSYSIDPPAAVKLGWRKEFVSGNTRPPIVGRGDPRLTSNSEPSCPPLPGQSLSSPGSLRRSFQDASRSSGRQCRGRTVAESRPSGRPNSERRHAEAKLDCTVGLPNFGTVALVPFDLPDDVDQGPIRCASFDRPVASRTRTPRTTESEPDPGPTTPSRDEKRKKVVADPAPSRHSSRHGGIMLPSLELRVSTGVSTEFSSAELLAGSEFAHVD